MDNYEELARQMHRNGNNCANSVYGAFASVNEHATKAPKPRSDGGKCGAVLAAKQLIKEMNLGDPSDFEKGFEERYGSILCAEIIRKNGRICNDLVGYAAARVEEMR